MCSDFGLISLGTNTGNKTEEYEFEVFENYKQYKIQNFKKCPECNDLKAGQLFPDVCLS